MKVVEELTQVPLPTECDDGPPCGRTARWDGVLWHCTRHPGHGRLHMATYDTELPEGPVTMIGLAWTD